VGGLEECGREERQRSSCNLNSRMVEIRVESGATAEIVRLMRSSTLRSAIPERQQNQVRVSSEEAEDLAGGSLDGNGKA